MVRYKRKYFFDASGRKFIVSTGDYSHLINKIIEIIGFDNKRELEDQVNSSNSFKFRKVFWNFAFEKRQKPKFTSFLCN
jgi:hypothetical protein